MTGSRATRWVVAAIAALGVVAATTAPAHAGRAGAARVPAAPSSACGTPSAAPPGETEQSMVSGGRTYTYFQQVPPAADGSTPLPLVLDFHGYSESASIHRQMSMLGELGDEQGFVTITPQGPGAIPMWDVALRSPDLAFVGRLLDRVEQTLCVDTNRAFAAGLSNGAFMVSSIACRYAGRIAAVAPVAGIRDPRGCRPSQPVPVITFHGTADGFVAFRGGLGERALHLPAPDGSNRTLGDAIAEDGDAGITKSPSVPVIVARWAGRNDCATPPVRRAIGTDVTLVRYRCPHAATVELYRVAGGGHAWPGSAFSVAIEGAVGHTTTTVSATALIWQFFSRHPLRAS